MNKRSSNSERRSLRILDELSSNDAVTQRDLSKHLGIALGLVNSYIKNLIAKGYVTVKSIPPKRYAYYLTPKGFTEKTRLTYELLHDYTRIYREARTNVKRVFSQIETEGASKVVFAGVDEVAEISYLFLHETRLELVGVVDDDAVGKIFFGLDVRPLKVIDSIPHDCVVVTSYMKRNQIQKGLRRNRIRKERVRMVF